MKIKKIIVYWMEIIFTKQNLLPAYIEDFDKNRTIGQIIDTMIINGYVEDNMRVEMFKHKYGDIHKYDKYHPYWSHDTKLSDYVEQMGGITENDVCLICVFIKKEDFSVNENKAQ